MLVIGILLHSVTDIICLTASHLMNLNFPYYSHNVKKIDFSCK